jgi:putative membrane protein
MLPRGFFGTDADLLIDVIIVALPVVIGVMLWARAKAKQKQWTQHRNIQTALAAVLVVVVGALEVDLHLLGGVEGMMPGGVSGFARWVLRVHLAFSTSTAGVWLGLIAMSWLKFPRPPTPGAFSAMHRRWGRIGLWLMGGTAATGGLFYLALFVA